VRCACVFVSLYKDITVAKYSPICNAWKTLSFSIGVYEPLMLTHSRDSILTSERHQNTEINDRIHLLEKSHHHIQKAANIKPAKNMLVVFYQLVQAARESASYKLRPMCVF